MRPISANTNAPTEKMAKWLVKELKDISKRNPPSKLSVKNAMDFATQLEDVELEDDEILMSFDVVSLYPSIPVEETLNLFEDWLKECNVDEEKMKVYLRFARFAMRNSFFKFRGKYYKQTSGTGMGVALAPFLSSDIFMGNFEKKIQNEKWFPRFWRRFIDDIFAVVKRDEAIEILNKLNSIYPEQIKFTSEKEVEGMIPFLDVLVKRSGKKLKLEIYRKPTHTDRFIPSNSYHSTEQKMSAFHSVIHRLMSIPMEKEDFEKEKRNIFRIAKINGYNENIITAMMSKYQRKKIREANTTFKEEKPDQKWVRMTYNHRCNSKIKKIFGRHGMKIASASQNKIKDFLTNNKDKKNPFDKSGIYKIECSCGLLYIGQSRRAIEERWKEHLRHMKNNCAEKSAVARHFLVNTKHELDKRKFKLVKNVNRECSLDAYESMYMQKFKDKLMNIKPPEIMSELFSLV